MKNFLVLIACLLISGVTIAQKQKRELKGVWQMVSGETNGNPNPSVFNNRTWEFKKDNTFEGRKLLPDNKSRLYNEGIYMLPTDTTMVCLHKYGNGKLGMAAFVYNYTINNDSLHLYGYYLTGAKGKPGLLQPVYIDEWWVKKKK